MPADPLPFAISPETLSQRRATGEAIAIVDVREPWEREVCLMPDSIAAPLSDLPSSFARLPRDRPLVVLCHHGVRSAQATMWLRAQGFDNAVNLEGGIDAWARRIDPSMRTY